MTSFFTPLLLFVQVILLVNVVHRAFPCSEIVGYAEGCCWDVTGRIECYHPRGSANCNIFGNNCVVCEFEFPNIKDCDEMQVHCSCFYCCEPQYAKYCLDGCQNCVRDGVGGCPENGGTVSRFKSINSDNSSSLLYDVPSKAVGKMRQQFDTIDSDKSGTISLKEAIAYLVETKNGTSADHLATDMAWFADMDSNGNSGIEPVEFDRSLI